jgi:hypothetical protein
MPAAAAVAQDMATSTTGCIISLFEKATIWWWG